MEANQPSTNGTPAPVPALAKFVLTIEFDPKTNGSRYGIQMDAGVPLGIIANVCDKVRQRVVNDQITIEQQQSALAQASKVVVAQQMPPGRPRG